MHGLAAGYAFLCQPVDPCPYGPLFAGPQVDQSLSEQPFDGLFPFQAAYCVEQHFGEPFFVPCHHPSLRRVKVHLADAACGS